MRVRSQNQLKSHWQQKQVKPITNNSVSKKAGTLFVNGFDMYSIKKSTKTMYLMFYLINLTDFCKYLLILTLMPAMCQTSWDRWLWKLSQKTPDCNIPPVNRFIGNIFWSQGCFFCLANAEIRTFLNVGGDAKPLNTQQPKPKLFDVLYKLFALVFRQRFSRRNTFICVL